MCFLVIGAAVGVIFAPQVVTAEGVNVSITEVMVSPRQPVTGEPVTVAVSIRNLASSDGDFNVTQVSIRTARGGEERDLTQVEDLGKVSPGTSLEVPLTITFEQPSIHELRVVVNGINAEGKSIEVRHPVTIQVQNQLPRVNLEVQDSLVGSQTTASVTVANGMSRDIRNIEIRILGDVIKTQPKKVIAEIKSGETREFVFKIEPNRPGSSHLSAEVEFIIGLNVVRTVSATAAVDIKPVQTQLSFNASKMENGVKVTVANLGNSEVEDIQIEGQSSNATVGRAIVSNLSPRKSASVFVPVSEFKETAIVNLTARFESDGRVQRETVGTVRFRKVPGRISLTGIDVQRVDGRLRISGTASNVGLSVVNSAIIRVVETDGLNPAVSGRDFFIGTIPASDFASFEVFAKTQTEVDRIILKIEYLSEGERLTEQVEVPISDLNARDENRNPSDNRVQLIPAAIGGAILITVALLMTLAWRNRRDGS